MQELLHQAMTETAQRHVESNRRYATAEYILRAVFHLLENPLVPYPLGIDYLKEKIGEALKPYGLVVRWERKPQVAKPSTTELSGKKRAA